MKDEMSRNKILVIEDEIEELKKDLEKLEDKVNK
jgi:tetrahydromethanopterin S-methyltransferase subunit G